MKIEKYGCNAYECRSTDLYRVTAMPAAHTHMRASRRGHAHAYNGRSVNAIAEYISLCECVCVRACIRGTVWWPWCERRQFTANNMKSAKTRHEREARRMNDTSSKANVDARWICVFFSCPCDHVNANAIAHTCVFVLRLNFSVNKTRRTHTPKSVFRFWDGKMRNDGREPKLWFSSEFWIQIFFIISSLLLLCLDS